MGAVIIAGRYVPRPPEDTPLNIKSQKIPAVLPTVGGNFPFIPRVWDYDHQDPNPGWVVESFTIAPVQKLVGGGFPFTPDYWRFGRDDSAEWYGRTRSEPLTLTLGVAVTPLTPTRWRFDYDQAREWVGESGSAFSLLSQTLQLYAPAPQRYFPTGDDGDPWVRKSGQVNNLLLNPPAVVNPFVPRRWVFDYDDRSVWYTKPGNIPPSKMPVGGGFPFVPIPWRFNYDDAAFWLVDSFAKPQVQGLVNGGLPIQPKFWKYDYDSPGFWVGKPVNVGIVQQLVIANPLVPQRWKFDHDSPGFWSGHPSNVPIQITNPSAPTQPTVITSTQQMPLPINAVLIGDQVYQSGTSPLSRNLFRSIFRE